MMIKVKTLMLSLSLFGNALAVLFVVSALTSATANISLYRMEGGISSAMIVSIPLGSEAATATFGPVEITLRRGESAFLQFASVVEGRQANWIIQALYDHRVIDVSQNPTGITITGIDSGTCLLQTLTNDGIIDIAIIRILE